MAIDMETSMCVRATDGWSDPPGSASGTYSHGLVRAPAADLRSTGASIPSGQRTHLWGRGSLVKADAFRFDGKRALVVGGATGMGAAAAELVQELGAEVVVMDHAEVTLAGAKAIKVDLRDRASIDAAVDECGGPIDALFSCAGAADGTPGIEKINFIGHRHLIDRAIDQGYLGRGSSIAMISSAAGLAWEKHLPEIKEYLATPDFDAAVAWIDAHPGKADYMWSKETLCAYVASQALPMLQRGIRINAILPGPTDTPLAQANADLWLAFGSDYRASAGIEASRPDEQAGPLVFLCSDAAAYLNGVTIITDAGYVSSGITGTFPDATPVVDFLYGRY
jgi:NAD(P)-dependent dehydrogenase (short-subunit alcohol dehydrogenase family)